MVQCPSCMVLLMLYLIYFELHFSEIKPCLSRCAVVIHLFFLSSAIVIYSKRIYNYISKANGHLL